MRMMLSLPYEPLIIYLETAWRMPGFPSRGSMLTPYFHNTVFVHKQIAFYYQVPTVSVMDVLFPIYLYNGIVDEPEKTLRFDGKREMIDGLKNWYGDCCHPNADGHRYAAILLANAIHSEMRTKEQREREYPINERAVGRLPNGWFVTKADEEKYGWTPLTVWKFDLPQMESAFCSVSNVNDSKWSHYAETKKEKWGLIANEQHSHLVVEITVEKSVYISFMKTYQNIGKAAVWFDDEPNKELKNCADFIMKSSKTLKNDTSNLQLAVDGTEYVIYDALWTKPASIGYQTEIKLNVNKTVKFMHFCVTEEQKFKLLSIISF